MDVEAIKKDLKSGQTKPVYFLMGEEEYFMDQITDCAEQHILTEDEKAFNYALLYGRDTDINTVVSEAKQFPVMAEKRLIIVKEAQNIKNWDLLESYLKQVNPQSLIIFAHKHKSLDKRKSVYKALKKADAVVECVSIKDHHLPAWIKAEVKKAKLTIGDRETLLLAEHIGNNLTRISQEINKLKIVLGDGGVIDTSSIEKHIGISKEYNIFELQNALGEGNVVKAVKITKFFADHPKENPLPVILAFLYGYFSKVISLHYLKDKSDSNVASKLKVPPFAVKNYKQAARVFKAGKTVQIISLLREYDLRSKGVNNKSADHGALLTELILKVAV
ncbi:MAG: DNA polymerase-3 subunit delta [Sphingobacteriales bacterium]|jgi:DNA polymerase-3 subunit delta